MEGYYMEERRVPQIHGRNDVYSNRQTVLSTPIKRRYYIEDTDDETDCDLLSDGGYFSISPSSPHNCSFRRNSEKLEKSFGDTLRSPLRGVDVSSTSKRLSTDRDFQRNRKYQSFNYESTPKKNSPYSPRRCFTERKYSAAEYLPYQPRSQSCMKSRRRHLDSNPDLYIEKTYHRVIPRRNLYDELDAVKTKHSYTTRQENCSFYSDNNGQRSQPCCTSLSDSNTFSKGSDYTRRVPSFRCDDERTVNHHCANTSESKTPYPYTMFDKPIHQRCSPKMTGYRKEQNTYPLYTSSEGQRIIDSIHDCEENEETNSRYFKEEREYLLDHPRLRHGEKRYGIRESSNEHPITYISDSDEESSYLCFPLSSNKSSRNSDDSMIQTGSTRRPSSSQGVCSCSDLKQGLLRLASGAYTNIRRKASSPEDFKQFKTELDLTNAFLQQTLEMIKRIKNVCGNCD